MVKCSDCNNEIKKCICCVGSSSSKNDKGMINLVKEIFNTQTVIISIDCLADIDDQLKERTKDFKDLNFEHITPSHYVNYGRCNNIGGAAIAFRLLSAKYKIMILVDDQSVNNTLSKIDWVMSNYPKADLLLTQSIEYNTSDYLITKHSYSGAGLFRGKTMFFGSPEYPSWPAIIAELINY